jgi:hypothetical protein
MKMTREEILELQVIRHDISSTVSIRQYFETLLLKLWEENEGFNGKRPWGNSGWDYDVYVPLIKAGLIEGELDENGYITKVDESVANKWVADNIIWPFFQ